MPSAPYNNTLWYETDSLIQPTINGGHTSGYLNAHYIDDGMNANQIGAGVPQCGQAPPPPPPRPKSAFYSPNNDPSTINSTAVADMNLPEPQWTE